jgi:hypothetical protein
MNTIFYETKGVNTSLNSVFLAGPTNRGGRTQWRTDAITYFEKHNLRLGQVVIPEFIDESRNAELDYVDIVEWELNWLENCTWLLFWIPRSDALPAFTTNIEFGRFHDTRTNVYCGSPVDAPKMNYLKYMWKRNVVDKDKGVPWFQDLESMCKYICGLSHL